MNDYEIVAALNRGLQTADDGTMTCPVCGDEMSVRQSYGPHWRRAHMLKLPRERQLDVRGAVACELCDMIVTSLANHMRDRHRPKLEASTNGDTPSAAVEQLPLDEQPDEQPDDDARIVTATDAGLAILLGMRPGSTLDVEQLPDIVEWLQETERVVSLFHGGKR